MLTRCIILNLVETGEAGLTTPVLRMLQTKAENIEGTGLGMKRVLRRAIDAQQDICRNGQSYM